VIKATKNLCYMKNLLQISGEFVYSAESSRDKFVSRPPYARLIKISTHNIYYKIF